MIPAASSGYLRETNRLGTPPYPIFQRGCPNGYPVAEHCALDNFTYNLIYLLKVSYGNNFQYFPSSFLGLGETSLK